MAVGSKPPATRFFVLLVTMILSSLKPCLIRLGVSAYVAFPTRLGKRSFSPLQARYAFDRHNGQRVDRDVYQKHWTTTYSSSSSIEATTTYEVLFDIQVPEGRCVGVQLADLPNDHPDALRAANLSHNNTTATAHWIYNHLHPEEVNYGLVLQNENHRRSFWLGRLAMRQALSEQRKQPWDTSFSGSNSILKDLHGRPQVPTGFLGSISHKRNTGVALVARIDEAASICPPRIGIGVDIEETASAKRRSVARKILTPCEQMDLGRIPVSRLRYSIALSTGMQGL